MFCTLLPQLTLTRLTTSLSDHVRLFLYRVGVGLMAQSSKQHLGFSVLDSEASGNQRHPSYP